jgi:hypothetical protein
MLRIREDNDFRAPSGTLAGGSVGSLTGLHGGNRGAGAHGGGHQQEARVAQPRHLFAGLAR